MRSVCLALLLLSQIGCAQYIAFTQKGPLDRSAIKPGADRVQIVGKLGAPKATTQEPGHVLVDTYNYIDGGKRNYSGWRAVRIVLYTGADLFTLFLSQLLTMPAELLMKGAEYQAVVEYEPGAGETWMAGRITETKLTGKSNLTVQERPGYAADRAAVLAAIQAEEAEAAAAAAAAAAANAAVSGGTCFAVAPDGLLLTANHVVGTADRVGVELADGRSLDAQVERRNASANAALLRVSAPTPQHVALGSQTALALGQPVFTLAGGAPAPDPAQPAEGAIDALAGPDGDASYIRAAIPPASGDAGAPLVDARGEVVGLVTQPTFPAVQPASGDTVQPDGVWAIRSAKLTSLFPGDVPALPPATSRDEAIARARGAICRVRSAPTQEASLEIPAPTAELTPQPAVEAIAPVEAATP